MPPLDYPQRPISSVVVDRLEGMSRIVILPLSTWRAIPIRWHISNAVMGTASLFLAVLAMRSVGMFDKLANGLFAGLIFMTLILQIYGCLDLLHRRIIIECGNGILTVYYLSRLTGSWTSASWWEVEPVSFALNATRDTLFILRRGARRRRLFLSSDQSAVEQVAAELATCGIPRRDASWIS